MSSQKSVKLTRNETKDTDKHEPQCPSETVSCEKIREAAYYKWEAAGSPCSDGIEFWLQAEAESEADTEPSQVK